MIDSLLADTKAFSAAVKQVEAVNINTAALKQRAIDLATDYFRNVRGSIEGFDTSTFELSSYDEDWQRLIRLAHGNNQKATYTSLLNRLVRQTREAAILSKSRPSDLAVSHPANPLAAPDELLVSTLENLVPTAAQSYRQGITDLTDSALRNSYRGTACEFREVLREVLEHLAPDSDVTADPSFKIEPNTQGPTMKQKVRFILRSRGRSKSNRQLTEKSVDLIESLSGDVARAVYDRASLSTHLHTTRTEVQQLKRYLDAVLYDILEIQQQQ